MSEKLYSIYAITEDGTRGCWYVTGLTKQEAIDRKLAEAKRLGYPIATIIGTYEHPLGGCIEDNLARYNLWIKAQALKHECES